MPTILIISRHFPPLGSVGASIRLVKLMKYASQQGWTFVVLTQDPDRPVVPEERLSEFLLAEIPTGTALFRIGNPFSGQTICARLARKIAGDSSLPWGLSVTFQGWKKLRHSKPDLILASSPPFTNIAIGVMLAALFAIPFVMDMKDDWVNSPAYQKKERLRRAVESWIEQRVMRKSSAAIMVTRSSYESWIQRYSPLGQARKIFFIPNGEDLEEYRSLFGRERKPGSERFRLLSAAAGYLPGYRDLTPFLQALELFCEHCPQVREEIVVEFLGQDPDSSYTAWLKRILPSSALQYSGALDRRELVEHLWLADLFFLVQPRENYTAISGTLYEYWATGKAPVLLFAETGASSSLVVDHHLGEHFLFNQVEEASQYIERVYQAFHNRHPAWIERSGSEEYDRRKTAQQMMLIWTNALNHFRRR